MDTREAAPASDVYRHRSPFRWAEYRLTDEGVLATEKRFMRVTRILVPYDQIPVHSTLVTHTSKWFFWTAVVSGLLFAVMAGNLALGHDIDPGAVPFYGIVCVFGVDDRPRAFIEAMQAQKLAFLRERMTRRMLDLSLHENRLHLIHLRETGLLDEEGFYQLRALVEELAPDADPSGNDG